MEISEQAFCQRIETDIAFVSRGVVALLTFYRETPLSFCEQMIAKSIKTWVEKGNEINGDYVIAAKEICTKYIEYLIEIANLKAAENQKKLEAKKLELDASQGYGS